MNNPYQAYKQQSVMTMTTSDMLKMLYEGIIKEVTFAKGGFSANNFNEIHTHLMKAQEILQYLKTTLDYKYEVANSLESLYNYFIRCLRDSNIRKDPAELDSVITMVTELRDTYDQAGRQEQVKEA